MGTPRGAVQPVTARSVVEQATQALRRAILTGALAPGAEYSLRELAGMLDISFIPIREALRSLESEGLVIMRPGRSAVVAPLDLDDLRGIYRLRRTLEPEIAARSCLLLSEAELDGLAERAAEFGAAGPAGHDDHHAFHLALLAPAATTWDIRVLTTLWRAASATSGSVSASSTPTRPSTGGAARPTANWSPPSAPATPPRSAPPSNATWPGTRRSPWPPSPDTGTGSGACSAAPGQAPGLTPGAPPPVPAPPRWSSRSARTGSPTGG
ncbi:GntR family transcriptional regulator [Streptomyces albidoflavus]